MGLEEAGGEGEVHRVPGPPPGHVGDAEDAAGGHDVPEDEGGAAGGAHRAARGRGIWRRGGGGGEGIECWYCGRGGGGGEGIECWYCGGGRGRSACSHDYHFGEPGKD